MLHAHRLKQASPDGAPGKPCDHVGMTGRDTDLRLDRHKAGMQANRLAAAGPASAAGALCAASPLADEPARKREVERAIDPREGGCGVGQA